MPDLLTSEPNLRFILCGVAVLFILIACLRGIGRLVVLAVALVAGGAAALAWWRYMPGATIPGWEKKPEDFLKWGALAAGLLTALLVRWLLRSIFSGGPGEMDGRARMRGGLLGILPSLFLVWAGAVGLRWAGAASHLRHVEQAVDAQDPQLLDDRSLMSKISRTMDRGVIGDVLNRTDFMNSREAEAMATLLVLQRKPEIWKRAWRHPQAGPVVQQPSFQRLADDRDVRHALSYSHYSRLLALPEMNAALKNTVLRGAVMSLDMEGILNEVIAGHPAGPIPRAEVVP